MGRQIIDIAGQEFERWKVISFSHSRKIENGSITFWNCLCKCGNEGVIEGSSLKSGLSKSCGCLRRETSKQNGLSLKTHGMTNTKTYQSWGDMLTRTTNPNYHSSERYIKRGVKICERWLKFVNFLEDMGERPEGLTLDRKDNNLGYSKENCRWATRKEQANNRASNVIIEFNGKKMNLSQWAESIGVTKACLNMRLKVLKWPLEKALSKNIKQPFDNIIRVC